MCIRDRCTLAPLAVADTEAREAAAVSLTWSGTRLTLDCGSRYTAEALWSAISAAALEVRREIVQDDREGPSAPSMAHCRGQVALGLLGGHREQLKVTLNAYRARPEAPAYVLGAGGSAPPPPRNWPLWPTRCVSCPRPDLSLIHISEPTRPY